MTISSRLAPSSPPAALIIAAMSVNLLHRYAGDRGSQHRDGGVEVSIIVLFIIAVSTSTQSSWHPYIPPSKASSVTLAGAA